LGEKIGIIKKEAVSNSPGIS